MTVSSATGQRERPLPTNGRGSDAASAFIPRVALGAASAGGNCTSRIVMAGIGKGGLLPFIFLPFHSGDL